ncbi:hypothetical protein TSAR_015179 [Trichomalopsis sarcophagae]|uniref:Uncharacterized protein n=1 Tax=Trichomalopsis sarcophagae TaxID=543379 RepID=A0A232FE43_9HYME|nr:hypothetical protein TSAR_015179 [Trichomalopsis sarcophagae]
MQSDNYDIVKSYDHLLHRTLNKIFRESCLGRGDRIKKFLRNLRQNSHQASKIKPILIQEQFFKKYFSKTELGRVLEDRDLGWLQIMTAELLVRSGADVNELFGLRNPQLIDPRCSIIYLLLSSYKFSSTNERLIRLVIKHGADLEVRNSLGQTVLHLTTIEGLVQMTKMLLKNGANDADNVASIGKFTEILQLLTRHRVIDFNPKHLQGLKIAKFFITNGVSFHDEAYDADSSSRYI